MDGLFVSSDTFVDTIFFIFFFLIFTYFESSGKSIVASNIILLSFPGKVSMINYGDYRNFSK